MPRQRFQVSLVFSYSTLLLRNTQDGDYLTDCCARSEDRVRAGAAKLAKMISAKQQGRLDGFFTVKPKEGNEDGKKAGGKKAGEKRKADEKGGAKKKGKK